MRFMVIRRADTNTEAGAKPTQALVDAMMKYNRELIDAGIMQGGEGLQPTSRGALIRFSGGKPTVIDGPFTEAKELVAGYSIFEVGSREEAIEWLKRWPVEDADGEVQIELRQVYTAEDFGEEFTPAIREQEEALRAMQAARQA
jgi:hypothetical protein